MNELTEGFAAVCAQWQQLYQEVVNERDAARAKARKLQIELDAAVVRA